jgi:hypothetical protein
VRAQAQARERDEQLAAAGREALGLRQAAERAAAERDAAAAGARRMEATAGLLQQRAAALEAQLQARARAGPAFPAQLLPTGCLGFFFF